MRLPACAVQEGRRHLPALPYVAPLNDRRQYRHRVDHEVQHPAATGKRLGLLTLTALGVVYGDIGTSPLYALRECFRAEYGIRPDADEHPRRPVAHHSGR